MYEYLHISRHLLYRRVNTVGQHFRLPWSHTEQAQEARGEVYLTLVCVFSVWTPSPAQPPVRTPVCGQCSHQWACGSDGRSLWGWGMWRAGLVWLVWGGAGWWYVLSYYPFSRGVTHTCTCIKLANDPYYSVTRHTQQQYWYQLEEKLHSGQKVCSQHWLSERSWNTLLHIYHNGSTPPDLGLLYSWFHTCSVCVDSPKLGALIRVSSLTILEVKNFHVSRNVRLTSLRLLTAPS